MKKKYVNFFLILNLKKKKNKNLQDLIELLKKKTQKTPQ